MLTISPSGMMVLKGQQHVEIKKALPEKQKSVKTKGNNSEYDRDLFEELRILRKEIADRMRVPPFMVFSDASLRDMCTKYPQTRSDFLKISGVGEIKAEKYGTRFMDAIYNYAEKNNIVLKTADEDEDKEEIQTENVKILSFENESSEKTQKEDTRTISYKMYLEGKSIQEIAEERELKSITVEAHLESCARL